MYQIKPNAIQRARISRGLTQEALAERCGYSDDTIRAWETGARTASLEALSIVSECLDAPWLTGVYLREQTNALNELIPSFTVGRPLAEAAAEYVSCVLDLVDERFDRKLIRMIADGHIDAMEREDYKVLMDLASKANRAYYEMRFAKEGNGDDDAKDAHR